MDFEGAKNRPIFDQMRKFTLIIERRVFLGRAEDSAREGQGKTRNQKPEVRSQEGIFEFRMPIFD